uniref:Uncharacterized protein n=1 Tax=Elphidium margaritaceum TaxID=933848 RepID=A0A7S0TD01_9EUKA
MDADEDDLDLPIITQTQLKNLPAWLLDSPQITPSASTVLDYADESQQQLNTADGVSVHRAPSLSVEYIPNPPRTRKLKAPQMAHIRRPQVMNLNMNHHHSNTRYATHNNTAAASAAAAAAAKNPKKNQPSTVSSADNTSNRNQYPSANIDTNAHTNRHPNTRVTKERSKQKCHLHNSLIFGMRDFDGLFRLFTTINASLPENEQLCSDTVTRYCTMIRQFATAWMKPKQSRLITLLLTVYDLHTSQEISPSITCKLLHQIHCKYESINSVNDTPI